MNHKVALSPIETVVAVARSALPEYGPVEIGARAPEFPAGRASSSAFGALRDLFLVWGLDQDRAGTPDWNPLRSLIRPGSRVLLKPNWVLHYNQSGRGLDCLLTHVSVIEAVLEYAALTRPQSIIIGDAPIQGCDFDALCRATGIDGVIARFRERGFEVELRDFRRTVLPGAELGSPRLETGREMDRYVLVDLGEDSLLEAISGDSSRFRVTMYDPEALARSHAPGRHRYLVAREVLEADTVINLPKLKCHKKTCLTGALKNLVGINGNKEYLPHHRKGGSEDGGDCYPGRSWVRRQAEEAADAANRRPAGLRQRLLSDISETLVRAAARLGGEGDIEGSWYGNDTAWRMVLDLQRILKYARIDGVMAREPQRTLVNITDAIVAGEGEGPLAPTPVSSGFLTGAVNPAAAEWVHARLMGFDPRKIPLVRSAFAGFRYALTGFAPEDIRVRARGALPQAHFKPPRGWRNHCELDETPDAAGEPAVLA